MNKADRTKKNTIGIRTEIIMSIIVVFLIFLLAYQNLSADKFDLLTRSFNRVAVGLSAILAVIFGPKLASHEIEKGRKTKEYLRRYPHDKFDIDWNIIESNKYPGAIYVLDKDDKKHHILNMKTMYDLGWHIYPRETIDDKDFRGYEVGDMIRTQGEAGE